LTYFARGKQPWQISTLLSHALSDGAERTPFLLLSKRGQFRHCCKVKKAIWMITGNEVFTATNSHRYLNNSNKYNNRPYIHTETWLVSQNDLFVKGVLYWNRSYHAYALSPISCQRKLKSMK
jgi:hypothetical protein